MKKAAHAINEWQEKQEQPINEWLDSFDKPREEWESKGPDGKKAVELAHAALKAAQQQRAEEQEG